MTLSVILTLVFLLLLWQALGHHSDSSQVAFLLRRTIVLIALMLLLVASSSMLAKKPALASEQELSVRLEAPSETETLTIQELYLFTKCFKVRLDPVAKAACEMEPLRCTIQSGIMKLKISLC